MIQDKALFDAQIKLWLQQSNGVQGLVNLLVMLVMTAIVWEAGFEKVTLAWLGFGIVTFIFRLVYFRWLPKHPEIFPLTTTHYARAATFSTFIAGAHWGVAALLFLNNGETQVFLFVMCSIVALSAGALTSMSAYLPTYIGFIVPSCTLTAITLFNLDNYALSALALVFMGICITLARNMNQTTRDIISLDFKNVSLVKELTLAKEDAEAANRAKSQFLASASHDLRQPLHAMGLFLHALEGRVNDEETREILSKVRQSHSTLDDLFSTLLEMTRLDSGAIKPIKSHLYLSSLLNPLISEFRQKAQNKGLSLLTGYEDVVVNTDRVLCGRILRNIINNSIKYTDKGRIQIRATHSDKQVKIDVCDTGIGIDPAEQKKIFDEYYQLNNVERSRQKGFGLGLAVVKRMTNLLKLPLHIESAVGQGSIFSITLPIGEKELIAAETIEPIIHPLSRLRIIVIDDDQSTLEAMKFILSEWQCQFLLAESLDIATMKIEKQNFQFDLIITDYRLTDGITGLEVIRQLKARFGDNIPGLIISGDTDPDLLRTIREQGFFLLHKPLKPTHLNKVIRQLTDTN